MINRKIAVFGCKSTTIFLLESLRKVVDIACVVTIDSEMGILNEVADYQDIGEYCAKNSIIIYKASRYDLKSERDEFFFKNNNFDVAFVIGWQRLIPELILKTFSIGVFGMHGSSDDLPIGRGRSPMNWALIERKKHFFTNIFKYDPGVDSGDILDTFVFSIRSTDTAKTMHYKNVLAMKLLINNNLERLLIGSVKLKAQKNITATFYPKRSPEDSLIDWNSDIFQIDAFIRAVTQPFNGAFSFIDRCKLIIWRASIFETDIVDFGYRKIKWGTIVEVFPSGDFLIYCKGGLLLVHSYSFKNSIKPLDRFKNDLRKRYFKLNNFGNYDLPGITKNNE